MQVQCQWCNNAGENVVFKIACKQEGLWVVFEYTAPGMSQQNGCVQQKFTTLFNRVCAMLNGGKFNGFLWNGLWAEVTNTAMLLKNNLLIPSRNLSPFQQFFGKGKRSMLSSMQKIGGMCIATYRDNTHWAKLANHGTWGFWVGYADGHPTSSCWVYNTKTKNIILTQDVTFLQKSYKDFNKVEKPVLITMSYDGSDC